MSSYSDSFKKVDLTQRFGEAGVFAKTYIPSKIGDTYEAWKKFLLDSNKQILHQRLANPLEHFSQFPELEDLIKCGSLINQWLNQLDLPAFAFNLFNGNHLLYKTKYIEKMKSIDFYSKYSSDGEEALLEELKTIKEELQNIPEPDFLKENSEDEEEGSEVDEDEEDNWGDDVDL